MVTTLRLGYSVMVSATDSDSVGRGSNPCTPAFLFLAVFSFTARFFCLGPFLSFPFFSAAVLSAFGSAAFSVRDGAIKKPVRRRVIQTPKARTSAVAIIFAQYAPSK